MIISRKMRTLVMQVEKTKGFLRILFIISNIYVDKNDKRCHSILIKIKMGDKNVIQWKWIENQILGE